MFESEEVLREAQAASNGDWRNCVQHAMRAMLSSLELSHVELNAVAGGALEVAVLFWRDGIGRPSDLLDANASVWLYLDTKHGSSTRIVDREDRMLRALLCVLRQPKDTEDLSDTIEWFASMLKGWEPR